VGLFVDGDFIDGEINSILAALLGYLITRSPAPPLSYAARASRSNIGIFIKEKAD